MTTLVLQRPQLVERLEQIAAIRNTTPELLLDTLVQEFVDKTEHEADGAAAQPAVPAEFLQEVEAFERLKPELLKQYKGQVVAIYQGKVVAVGDNRMDVFGVVLKKLGPVPCYIEWVDEQTPRRVRMPSVRVVR